MVRCNWHTHISVPLQIGRGQARPGVGPGGGGESGGGSFAKELPAHRSEKVPDVQGDVGARPAPCNEEQGAL